MIKKWLAIGIILLFVGTCIIPATAQNRGKQTSSRGNWLYVGGSGPGNYTRIQDAIDNASEGDTVFVYKGMYPDYVYIIELDEINIHLIGEDKYTTIITNNDLPSIGSILVIRNSYGVNISGFTIQLSYTCSAGIEITSSRNVSIHDTIIQNIPIGIALIDAESCSFYNNFITLSYCDGLYVGSRSANCSFHDNILSNNEKGVEICASGDCLFSNNTIINNSIGFEIIANSGEQIIEHNDIRNNDIGIKINYQADFKTIIQCNNIVENTQSVQSAVSRHLPTVLSNPFSYLTPNTTWDKNYWSDWKTVLPRLILSLAHIWVHSPLGGEGGITIAVVPTFKLDRHPAQEPYDIPGI